MLIPGRKLEDFAGGLVEQCFSSRQERLSRGAFFQNYFMSGASDQANPALFNKTFASVDDLESLLFSPVSLRFHIGDPDNPNVVNEAKGRAAAARLRKHARTSETDTMISAAVLLGLVKGKGFIKQLWKRGEFAPILVEPEDMGVLRENHTQLDEDMEAFAHKTLITPYQFERLIWPHSEAKKTEFRKRAKKYYRESEGGLGDTQRSAMSVVVGGLYPLQPAGVPSATRGIVDWMSQPKPSLAPEVAQTLMELNELWVWNDELEDWTTFQQIGAELLIEPTDQFRNLIAYDEATHQSAAVLKGVHPFREFCTNPVPNYFWGRSELSHLVGLQEAINARIAGTNKLLRKQEDPTRKFIGSTSVNQNTLSKYNRPGGYFVDGNPNAKVETDTITIPQDLWGSLHEYERMFDDIMGLPPIARGKGEAGVRSASHANTLVRQFSPRFKDRALLTERNVEALGGLMLDLAKAHDARKMTAWVAKEAAGVEAREMSPLEVPPAKGLVPVPFAFADLPEEASLTIDSHSASPAFAEEAKQLDFNLVKIGAMSPSQLVERVDVTDPDTLEMDIVRRGIAQAEAAEKAEAVKALGKKH